MAISNMDISSAGKRRRMVRVGSAAGQCLAKLWKGVWSTRLTLLCEAGRKARR